MARGGFTDVLLFILLTLLFLADPLRALGEWSAVAEQKTSYTTDAFQFSSARRLRFSEDPTQPTVVPLEKPEDVIWEPSLELIKSDKTDRGTNEISVKAHGYIYTDHAIFNHGDYHIQDRLSLDKSSSILVRYRYVPNLFLGPNFERRTGMRSTQEERVTSHHWRAEFDRQVTDDISVALIGRYGLRLYNESFAERDTHFYSAGPRIEYRVTRWITMTVGYLYERGLAEGRHDTQFNDDVSYFLHLVTVGADVKLGSRLNLNLAYSHVRKSFTSNLTGDTHLGRFDLTHQGIAALHYSLTSAAAVMLEFQRTQRSSNNALRDFNDTIVSIGGQYRF